MSVGVFMTTYNMLPMTKRAVASLKASMDVPYEFLIQDHRSIDGTKDWCIDNGISYQEDSHPNSLAAALNQAIHYFIDNYPEVDLISFIHNDMTFYKGWISTLVDFVKANDIHGKISSENPRLMGLKEDDNEAVIKKMREMPRWAFRPGNECPSTFTVDLFKKDGIYFDENYIGIGGYEDWDYNRVAIQHGYEVVILTNSLVWHSSMGTRKHLEQSKEGQHNSGYYFSKWGDGKCPV